jgi:hypothetical protein
VFDYMALQKPILLVENDHGPLAEMLGSSHFICDDSQEVQASLIEMLKDAHSHADAKADPIYTRRRQAKRLAQLILDQ